MFPSFNARAIGLRLPAGETVELAASLGFAGVDLLVRDLIEAGEDPALLRARMDDLGLRGGAWPLPVDWRGDQDRFRADLGRLPRLAATASSLGLERTGTWVMPETPDRPATDAERSSHREAIAAMHVERLGAIARVLADQGISLGLEVIGVESTRTGRGIPFVHRLADLDLALVGIWDQSPNLGILVDAFHLFAAGEALEEGLAWGIKRVLWVHVADLPAGASHDPSLIQDLDRGLPGENGAVDCRGLLQRLAELDYDGPVTVEPLAACRSLDGLDDRAKAQKVAKALRSVWPATVL